MVRSKDMAGSPFAWGIYSILLTDDGCEGERQCIDLMLTCKAVYITILGTIYSSMTNDINKRSTHISPCFLLPFVSS